MTSALSAALKKPTLDQGASSALADSLKAPQKAATSGGFDLSTIPLPPTAFPGLYHDSSTGEDYVADLDNLALSTSIGTQFAGSYKSRSGTPIVRSSSSYHYTIAQLAFRATIIFTYGASRVAAEQILRPCCASTADPLQHAPIRRMGRQSL